LQNKEALSEALKAMANFPTAQEGFTAWQIFLAFWPDWPLQEYLCGQK